MYCSETDADKKREYYDNEDEHHSPEWSSKPAMRKFGWYLLSGYTKPRCRGFYSQTTQSIRYAVVFATAGVFPIRGTNT